MIRSFRASVDEQGRIADPAIEVACPAVTVLFSGDCE